MCEYRGGGGPDESFLFLLTSALTPESDCPEMGLAAWERWLLLDRFGAPSTFLENLAACFIRTSGRSLVLPLNIHVLVQEY